MACLKPGTHWWQSWTQHRWLKSTKSTVSLWPRTHWRQSRKEVRHSDDRVNCIGDKDDRVGDNVDHDKLSNSSCCRFVDKTGNKVDRIGDSRLCRQRVVVLGLRWQSNNVLAPVYWCSMARRWASEKFQCFASFFHSFGRSCFVASFHRMSLSCSAACGFARFSGNVLTEEYSVVVVPFYTRQKQHISK